jgi:hypothetical protein
LAAAMAHGNFFKGVFARFIVMPHRQPIDRVHFRWSGRYAPGLTPPGPGLFRTPAVDHVFADAVQPRNDVHGFVTSFIGCSDCQPVGCFRGIIIQFFPRSLLVEIIALSLRSFGGHPTFVISAKPLTSVIPANAGTQTLRRGKLLPSVIPTNAPYFRHPGGRRDPDLQPVSMLKAWVPTFVGMTKVGRVSPG